MNRIIYIFLGMVILLINNCKKDDDGIIDPGVVTDVDGHVYSTVTIGRQVWMGENLKTTRYSNGDSIGTTYPPTLDIFGEINPKYQWAYEGIEDNAIIYGRLYTWYTIADGRNVCPTGWHVPSESEWTELITYLGGEEIAGGKLKEAGLEHWNETNVGATNESGFTALPGGLRGNLNNFGVLGIRGHWWSATPYAHDPQFVVSMILDDGSPAAYMEHVTYANMGESIRCLKD